MQRFPAPRIRRRAVRNSTETVLKSRLFAELGERPRAVGCRLLYSAGGPTGRASCCCAGSSVDLRVAASQVFLIIPIR